MDLKGRMYYWWKCSYFVFQQPFKYFFITWQIFVYTKRFLDIYKNIDWRLILFLFLSKTTSMLVQNYFNQDYSIQICGSIKRWAATLYLTRNLKLATIRNCYDVIIESNICLFIGVTGVGNNDAFQIVP